MNCEGDHEIHCMNFNQDGSSLSAGCKSGFYLYGLSNATEKLDVRIFGLIFLVSSFIGQNFRITSMLAHRMLC